MLFELENRKFFFKNRKKIAKNRYEGIGEGEGHADAAPNKLVFDSNIQTIDQFFPNKRGRKNSLAGEVPMKKENTYADKVEVTQTNDAFPDYIGHQCRKGRKPESPNQDSFSITMHDGVMMQVFAVFGTIFTFHILHLTRILMMNLAPAKLIKILVSNVQIEPRTVSETFFDPRILNESQAT